MMRAARTTLVLAVLALALGVLRAQSAARDAAAGEWRVYHHDLASTRYSPLDQINRSNVANLDVAWRWRSDTVSTPPEYKNESTPLMVHGTLYFTAGPMRWVIAADAVTGATKWTWHLDEGERGRHGPRRDSGRGVSYWTDGTNERIFTVTPGFNLVALDAKTGVPVDAFGDHGIVDLKAQLGVTVDLVTTAIGSSSPPLVFEDVVITGPALEIGTRPVSMKNVPGRIIAIDARTGKFRWRFNTIPQKGELGYDTWQPGSAEYTGNTGAWAPLTLDEKRGYVYLPVEDATGDYYGGHRKGDNLFSSTLVCVDARTGKRIWHFQIVHHDIWDRDIAAAPILADVTVGGRKMEVVVQLTKQAYAYVFDRVTGKPVWPINEQAVPQSDVPGEKSAATQPIPTKPAAFDRQGVTPNDLIDFTPDLHAEAVKAVAQFRMGIGPFAPPSVQDAPDGTKGTDTGILYVGSYTSPAVLGLVKDPQHTDMDWVGGNANVPRVRGLPLVKPPYSRVTAINLNTGDHVWMAVNGDTPPAIKSNAALAGLTIPKTGAQARPEVMATKTLLFSAEGYGGAAVLHVLDKATGATITDLTVPGTISSSPMTYALNGKQYVAFWVSDQRAQLAATLVAMTVK
jgi:quinoprotein glucose dehydrogenase